MGKSLLIARRELQAFFTTWMGYIIIAAGLLLDGIMFQVFAMGNDPKFSAEVLQDFFKYASGISMIAGLLLAMRLVAEERQNGTIILFYTSPVTERQLIYGKFLSALLFSLILHVVSVYLPALIMIEGKISLGHLASGYMVLVFLGGAAIAIALFASTIAPNQLIAGILSGVIFALLLVLWMLAEVADPPFKEIFSFMAIHNKHFNAMAAGIVNTMDVVYYFLIIFVFLELSVRALQARRWRG